MSEEPTPIEELQEAVRRFIERTHDEPTLLKDLVVVYETTMFREDGNQAYMVRYACGPGTGLSAGIGLCEMGKAYMVDDILSADRDDDE